MLAQQEQQVRDAFEDRRASGHRAVCERDDLNDYLTTSAHSSPAAKTEQLEGKLLDTRKWVFIQRLGVENTRGA